MRIHWRNIAILIFGLLIVFLLLRHGHAISEVVEHLRKIGPGQTMEDQTVVLLALGFICVSLVAIVRLLVQGQRRDRDRRDRQNNPPPG